MSQTTAVLRAELTAGFYQLPLSRIRGPGSTIRLDGWQDADHRGRAASSARTWRARSPRAATSCACSPGAARTSSPLDGLEFERATGDVTDRRAVRRAMDGVERVFHVAGRTSLRPADRDVVFAANLRGARVVFEAALEAGVERLVHTSTAGAIGAAKPRGTADETTPFDDRPPRDRLRQLQARGRARGAARSPPRACPS